MQNELHKNIIKACRRNELSAQEELYQFYADRLYYVIFRYVNDKYFIENIMQDVFLKVFINISKYDEKKAALSTWIKRIAIHESINHCKKKSLNYVSIDYINDVSNAKSEALALSNLKAEDIITLITKIPEKYRIIFNLFEIDGYGHREIAELLEIKTSTSRSYLTRAKQMIQEQLKDYYSPEILRYGKGTK